MVRLMVYRPDFVRSLGAEILQIGQQINADAHRQGQNSRRAPSWIWRAGAELAIEPKAGESMEFWGRLKLVWFRALKNSPRSWRERFDDSLPREIDFEREKSR